jgi:hypothetical protein
VYFGFTLVAVGGDMNLVDAIIELTPTIYQTGEGVPRFSEVSRPNRMRDNLS